MKTGQEPTSPRDDSDITEPSAETTKEFTLSRGEEKMVVRNAEEADRAIRDGFNPGDLGVISNLKKDFGINFGLIKREIEIKNLEGRFAENEGRKLVYLSKGLDNWFEDVNNYWYNSQKHEGSRYREMSVALTGLERQLIDIIDHDIATILHQDPKDMGARSFSIDSFNSRVEKDNRIPKEFRLDRPGFREKVWLDMAYKCDGKVSWENKKIPDRLQPKDANIRDYHPLLEPFREILGQLNADGVTELPGWLKQQGEMAGLSAVYQDIPIQLNDWIEKAAKTSDAYKAYVKEQGIQDAPSMNVLPIQYAENLAIIDRQIHRRKK